MSLNTDYMRESAGLGYQQKEKKIIRPLNESLKKVTMLDLEAQLLRSFSDMLRSLGGIKERMDNTSTNYVYHNHNGVRVRITEKGKAKLESIAKDKVKLIEEAIKETFGSSEMKKEEERNEY